MAGTLGTLGTVVVVTAGALMFREVLKGADGFGPKKKKKKKKTSAKKKR